MVVLNRPCAYSRVMNEDPDELRHCRAQFLIYRAMQKADKVRRRQPSWLRVRILKLKIKIGKRLRSLTKRFSLTMFSAKGDFYKQLTSAFRSCKHLLNAKQGTIVRTLSPMS